MRNWKFDQLCLLARDLNFPFPLSREHYERLASLVSRLGPPRNWRGVRAKFENLRGLLRIGGHKGLYRKGPLDAVVLAFRLNYPKDFERHCNSLL